ncbi:MAG: hypothetical protein U0Z53_28560 [Blastocatellia bacterium]
MAESSASAAVEQPLCQQVNPRQVISGTAKKDCYRHAPPGQHPAAAWQK